MHEAIRGCAPNRADAVVFFVREGGEFQARVALVEHDLAHAVCGRPAVHLVNRCIGLVLAASISSAISEGIQFVLADCKWGDFPLAYPTSAWHDIWRSLSYWVGLLCLVLVLLSSQRTVAALAIRTSDFATTVIMSLVWVACLVILWSWEMERSLLLDFPRFAVHAIVWPAFVVADSFHPGVRKAFLRFFGPAACAILLGLALVLRLPASDRHPRNRTYATWGVQRIGLFETMAFCALSLALIVFQGVWKIWRNPLRMAYISQAVPFRTASICLWSRSRGPAKVRRTSLAMSPLVPPATSFGESPFPRVRPSLAAEEPRAGLADAQLRRLTDNDAGGPMCSRARASTQLHTCAPDTDVGGPRHLRFTHQPNYPVGQDPSEVCLCLVV